LKTAFTDIESTGEAVSETRKVRVLLQGITDPRLVTAKSTEIATPTLKDTFDNAINVIAQFQVDRQSHKQGTRVQQHQVAIVEVEVVTAVVDQPVDLVIVVAGILVVVEEGQIVQAEAILILQDVRTIPSTTGGH
jgi:hypothetical protein